MLRPVSPIGAPRRFCRFRTEGDSAALVSSLPASGVCLSAYVLLRSAAGARRVIAGKIDLKADWARIGALSMARAERVAEGWMLPSCHLEIFESPSAAADRILSEQLGLTGIELAGPRVYSESWGGDPAGDPHWDVQFVFEGLWPEGRPRSAAPWRALELVDLDRTPASAFVRGHADILALAGLPATGDR